jgi:hypothetical protein
MSMPRLAAVTFVLGVGLVFLVELSVARIIGVPLIFVGIALGVAAIASPEFLKGEREGERGDA